MQYQPEQRPTHCTIKECSRGTECARYLTPYVKGQQRLLYACGPRHNWMAFHPVDDVFVDFMLQHAENLKLKIQEIKDIEL